VREYKGGVLVHPYRADTVAVTRDGPVTVVEITRPERRNAVDSLCADQLRRAFVDFDQDPGQSVAVLTGSEGTFCAGRTSRRWPRAIAAHPDDGPGPMGPTRLTLSKPVIAAVEGFAVAGASSWRCGATCGWRPRTPSSGCSAGASGAALRPGNGPAAPDHRHGRAMDLILTGRAVEGPEALQLGLVNRVVASGTARQAAVDLAAQLALLPQFCLRSDRMSAH